MSRAERNPQTDRGKINQASQQKVRRRCTCGRLVTGNAAWWSHLDAAERRGDAAGHVFAGTR